jgi:integrase
MARTVRDTLLETRTARSRLKARNKPYFRTLEPGMHLGYRKRRSAPGRWLARHYVGAQKYELETIGTADDFSDADGVAILSFGQAQTVARRRMVERAHAAAGRHGPYTVEDAISDYLNDREVNRGGSVKLDRYRAEALILRDLGDIEVAKLTTERLRNWLMKLATLPTRAWTKAPVIAKDADAKRRRRASANRVRAILVAALNRAWREGKVPSDAAWRRVKPFKQTDRARAGYLSIDEARRLINACEPDFRSLVQAALVSGARYGELCRLTVADFNLDAGSLAVHRSKTGQPRYIILADEGAAVFRQLCVGRAGAELIFRRADGDPWGPANQARRMTAACARAKIEPPVGYHQLRHTWASHAVMNGAALMVVARNLGHADTKMVEKHYGHLSSSFITDEIRRAAPRFGMVEPSNIVALPKR